MNTDSTYDLSIIDEFTPIRATFSAPLPNFIKFIYPTFYFSPLKKTDEGDFSIQGTVANKYASRSFSFKVKVTNKPP
jgi:hypothetical protein